ncbi:hypothetical protein [Inquilinus sp. OTU3971]|uniref:hypothetical protein n=1 Tax=Inquilinus sp. OTU3971 TaxID=3043855 RepID=UPI00313EE635
MSKSATLAQKCLKRLEEPFDDWEAECFRRTCGFLEFGVVRGAASSWNAMALPLGRRSEACSGEPPATPMTEKDADRLRRRLVRMIETQGRVDERSAD